MNHIGKILAIAGAAGLLFSASAAPPFGSGLKITPQSGIDGLLFADWARNELPVPEAASDSVMVRRLYLDLAGRLPTPAEAKAYVADTAPDKKVALIDRLLASDDFTDYFTQHRCDELRVKSEFPINLWPNAVYVYARRIRQSLACNEPYRDFVRTLLLGSGSNFRSPESNFYRAVAVRTPEGFAEAVALTFMGRRRTSMSEAEFSNLQAFFEGIGIKRSREWKEEVVFYEPSYAERTLRFPDGRSIAVAPGADSRAVFADWLLETANPIWSRVAVNRIWFRFFGRGIVEPADDMRPDNPAANSELLDFLARRFASTGGDVRDICRLIADSAAYAASSVSASGNASDAAVHFSLYQVRRLDAEVLDDAICGLTGMKRNYSSVIPEPFSFIPSEQRTVKLYDGSMSSAFLLLFGRPARDSGILEERSVAVNAKQRQHLYNSGALYAALGEVNRRPEMKYLSDRRRIEEFYWLFYSRPPQDSELEILLAELNERSPSKASVSQFMHDLAWIMVNSKEFLYRH